MEEGGGGTESRKTKKRYMHGMFRFADGFDVVLMLLGTIGSIGDGCAVNCLLLFASNVMNSLGYGKDRQGHVDFMHEVEKVS